MFDKMLGHIEGIIRSKGLDRISGMAEPLHASERTNVFALAPNQRSFATLEGFLTRRSGVHTARRRHRFSLLKFATILR